MKLIIVLKKTDADGLGGEILESHGLTRSKVEPGVFAMVAPIHAVDKLGMGDASWSQPEATTQQVLEALTDYGIRPMRVFQRTDSTAGLTPINASTGMPEPSDEEESIHDVLAEVESVAAELRGKKKPISAKAPGEGTAGKIIVQGGNSGGTMTLVFHVTMSPRFTPNDLGKTIFSLGKTPMDRFLKEADKLLKEAKYKVTFEAVQGIAGQDNSGLWIGAEVKFKGDSQAVVNALEKNARRNGLMIEDATR